MLRDPSCTVDGGDDGLRRLMSPLAIHGSLYYCSPSKRFRRGTPRHVGEQVADHEDQFSLINVLPDECLFEILRRLGGNKERESAACVSKRWLMVLSSIRGYEHTNCPTEDVKEDEIIPEGDGCVMRCLEGKEATDVRLAAVAVRASGFNGLGKIMIRGGKGSRVTDAGLRVLAQGSPSLRTVSICDASLVGDEGLSEIARNCPLLEKIDLCKCPLVSDNGLIAIAEKCQDRSSLTVEYCPKLRNEGLQSIGRFCPNLQSISIVGCPFVGDQGVASLVSSASSSLTKIKLQDLNITDVSLAVIGHYGRVVTDMTLASLPNVNERGFWVMGNTRGLQNLKCVTLNACRGATDLGLEALAKGCPVLKKVCVRQCCYLSDAGLRAFAGAAGTLENLQLEECNRITLVGLLSALLTCNTKFKSLTLVKCMGIKDISSYPTQLPSGTFLRSLSIRDCPGFGSSSLAMTREVCPNLQNIELSGLLGVSNSGILPLIQNNKSGLVKVNLSGCVDAVDDKVVSALTRAHGGTLKVLNLEGCKKITDVSVLEIAANCYVLEDLDVSKSAVTDDGVSALASAAQLQLQVLSLWGCSQISDNSLPFLGSLGLSLLGLNLQNCNQMSESSVRSLQKEMIQCDILS